MTNEAPVPDPTILTTDAIGRGLKAERDYTNSQLEIVKERLRGIDEATKVLNETLNRVPTQLTQEIGHLTSLTDEKFTSVSLQFHERDTRSERESRDNKVAVDAAFAAQKEAAAKQDEANAKAIDKSEKATTETIKTNQELSRATTDALTKSLDEVKLDVSRILASRQGAIETKSSNSQNYGILIGAIGTLIGMSGLIITIAINATG